MRAREHGLIIAVLLGVASVAHVAQWPSVIKVVCATGITAELIVLSASWLWQLRARYSAREKS